MQSGRACGEDLREPASCAAAVVPSTAAAHHPEHPPEGALQAALYAPVPQLCVGSTKSFQHHAAGSLGVHDAWPANHVCSSSRLMQPISPQVLVCKPDSHPFGWALLFQMRARQLWHGRCSCHCRTLVPLPSCLGLQLCRMAVLGRGWCPWRAVPG